MQACILHHRVSDVQSLPEALENENIATKVCTWNEDSSWDSFSLWDSSVLIIYLTKNELPLHLKDIRSTYENLPIIIFNSSQQSTKETRDKCLKQGADAYISSPITAQVLATEIKKLLIKKEFNAKPKWLRAFDCWLDLARRAVKRKDQYILLRNKEFSLLEFFMMNRGKVLTRDVILEHVWDRNATFSSNTVDVHIRRLRRKIDDPFKEKLIHTIPCMGYVFDKKKWPATA